MYGGNGNGKIPPSKDSKRLQAEKRDSKHQIDFNDIDLEKVEIF